MLRNALSALGLGIVLLGATAAPAAEELAAYVDVAWAPGDGKQALERAISNRLLDKGFTVTGTPQLGAYEIQGVARLFPAERGKETIRIDWTIFGPEGTRLGNVTQTKVIRKGSLDRHWGAAADAAASAALQDMMQYLPQRGESGL
jgi:hypothetical protein